jgi:hypothetical protein
MRRALILLGLALVYSLAAPRRSRAQVPTELGREIANANLKFLSIAAVLEVRPGLVYVNDPVARRLVLLDSMLTLKRVILDSTAQGPNSYGAGVGALLRYRGDSLIFVDIRASAVLILTADGRVARTEALPSAVDGSALPGGSRGFPAFDSKGRLIFRLLPARTQGSELLKARGPAQMMADSAALVAVDFSSHKTDTVAFLRTIGQRIYVTESDAGEVQAKPILRPIVVVDDWAVRSDGSVGVLRGRDYHLDVLSVNTRTVVSQPRIPFAWVRLSDEDKRTLVDSARKAAEAAVAARIASGATRPSEFPYWSSAPEDLPDHRPAFVSGALRADNVANLWVRTTTHSRNGLPQYDVLNAAGALVDRVTVPANSAIAGFGQSGTVFLAIRDELGVGLRRFGRK